MMSVKVTAQLYRENVSVTVKSNRTNNSWSVFPVCVRRDGAVKAALVVCYHDNPDNSTDFRLNTQRCVFVSYTLIYQGPQTNHS